MKVPIQSSIKQPYLGVVSGIVDSGVLHHRVTSLVAHRRVVLSPHHALVSGPSSVGVVPVDGRDGLVECGRLRVVILSAICRPSSQVHDQENNERQHHEGQLREENDVPSRQVCRWKHDMCGYCIRHKQGMGASQIDTVVSIDYICVSN